MEVKCTQRDRDKTTSVDNEVEFYLAEKPNGLKLFVVRFWHHGQAHAEFRKGPHGALEEAPNAIEAQALLEMALWVFESEPRIIRAIEKLI
jgi:hypothetical protein